MHTKFGSMRNILPVKLSGLNIAVLLVLLMTAAFGLAQSSSTILGTATDSSGNAVAGATVTIINADTAQTRTATTSGDGAYRVPGLQAGHYSVRIEKSGFKIETRSGLTLDVAQELSVNAALQVGSVSEQVVVTGDQPLVNTSTSSLGGLVNDTKIADLPLNGRNYIDLSLMQPGVTQNANQAGVGGMSGTVFSTNGAPTISNNFLLDGTSMVNQSGWSTASMAGTTLGVDGIKEYRVITSVFPAEYGMTMGSQLVMVSKGGTNRFHGDLFEYLRNSALDARNYFDPVTIPDFHRNNFGVSFGGPIRKDKTFFYAVYEGLQEDLGYTVLDQVPAAGCHGPAGATITNVQCPQLGSTASVTINAATAPILTLYPIPGPDPKNVTNNTFTFPTSSSISVNFGSIRVDHTFSASDSIFARVTTDRSNLNGVNAGALTAASGVGFPQFRGTGNSADVFATLAENHIFSPTLLNTGRISFSRTNFSSNNTYNAAALAGIPPILAGEPFGTVSIGGISNLGANSNAGPPSPVHLQNIYTLSDDVDYIRGKNAFKYGVLINHYENALTTFGGLFGNITYSGLAGFLKGIPSSFKAETPGSNFNRDFIFDTYGFYAQDDWRIKPRLTLNVGLRYEFRTAIREMNGKEYAIRNHGLDAAPTQGEVMQNKTFLNFSPRAGFAWDVFGNGSTSVRGGVGLYYDLGNYGNAFVRNALGTPPLSAQSTFSNTTANQVYTFPITLTPAQVGHTLSTIDYNANQPKLLQYNLGIERQLPGRFALNVSTIGTRGTHLWTQKEGNPTIPTSIGADGTQYWANSVATCSGVVPSCRINPNFTVNNTDTTAGDSWYNSLQAVLTRRLRQGLELQAAYTYAHSLDTTEGNLAATDCTGSGMDEGTDPTHPRIDFGPSCFDVRHNLRFNLLYHFPHMRAGMFSGFVNGWWVGNIVAMETGFPFSPVLSGNRSNSSELSGTSGVSDRVNVGTATVVPGALGPDGNLNSTTKTFIPFDRKSVYIKSVQQWFNPLMFAMAPMVPCPTNTTVTCGQLGNASRGLLRGPHLATWDFSLVKDTAVPIFGQGGSVQFRAEFFNILNHANFGMPSGTIFTGSTSDIGSYSETPLTSAGQITNTATTSRQIQLAVKLIF